MECRYCGNYAGGGIGGVELMMVWNWLVGGLVYCVYKGGWRKEGRWTRYGVVY